MFTIINNAVCYKRVLLKYTRICSSILVWMLMGYINSSPPSAAYMRQLIGSALVQIIACCLFAYLNVEKVITCSLKDAINAYLRSNIHWCFSLIIPTHWGRVTHICVGNLTLIGSDNGLSSGRRQAIIWTDAAILSIGPYEQTSVKF